MRGRAAASAPSPFVCFSAPMHVRLLLVTVRHGGCWGSPGRCSLAHDPRALRSLGGPQGGWLESSAVIKGTCLSEPRQGHKDFSRDVTAQKATLRTQREGSRRRGLEASGKGTQRAEAEGEAGAKCKGHCREPWLGTSTPRQPMLHRATCPLTYIWDFTASSP